MNFFGAFSGLPLRPLLLAAGAAAATASIYTYVKRSEDTTAEPEDTTEGPDTEVVKDQMMKLLVSKIQLQDRVKELEELLCEAHRDCDLKSKEREQEREAHSILLAEKEEMIKTLTHKEEFLKVTLVEAKENHQKDVETIHQLEKEKSDLTEKVETLRETVEELGNQLTETHVQCDELTDECERERETHNILQSKYDEMKKTMTQLEEENNQMKQEQEAHNILQSKYDEMIKSHEEELLKERETHNILQAENNDMKKTITQLEEEKDEMKKTLNNKEEFLKVTLAEAEEKHQKIISQLEEEMFDLTEKVETLRDTVKILMKKLIKTDRECDERINVTLAEAEEKHQKDVETIHQLEKEKDEMKKTLNNKDEFLKVTLAEAEEKHQKIISQLEEEMFDLTEKVETLRDTVKILMKKLIKTDRECDERINVTLAEAEEKHQKTISQLEEEMFDLTEKVETLRDTVKILMKKLIKTDRECDERINVTLAEAEEKHQKAVETIHQLEKEKSDLTEKVEALRETVEDMGNQLIETNRECDELLNERETHNILQAENDEMKKTLSHKEELLKVTLAEAEEKHQKIISQLEEEMFDLTEKVETLRDTVKILMKKLIKTDRECDERINVTLAEAEEKHQKDVETIHQLEKEKDEMKKTLNNKEEFLKVTLAQAVDDVETIAQLEKENVDLRIEVETLRDTVKILGKKLFECNRV
ncbi:protein Hook homolog 1-like [Hemibagrus wyckioides]|uniref:protein Hook homolog 1-like n=1 Tax=Hemibagrus wyckioides TaxID=337641 RepID=UPI00266BBE1A|nr:protein Hook homolog 1-like [Hemibagrus wyckioides]